MLDDRFNHAAELQIFQTNDYELTSKIWHNMNDNNDGGRLDDIVNKVNNGIKDRKDPRANL